MEKASENGLFCGVVFAVYRQTLCSCHLSALGGQANRHKYSKKVTMIKVQVHLSILAMYLDEWTNELMEKKYINYERFTISVGVVSWQSERLIFNFSFFQKPYVLKKRKK